MPIDTARYGPGDARCGTSPGGPVTDVDTAALGRLLDGSADRLAELLDGTSDWDLRDPARGQYRVDVAADEAAVPLLVEAGLGVLSEESGRHHPDRPLTAVIDPLDGTTNASRGLPWFATSICVVDDQGPVVALVVDQVHGHRYRAVRGEGATCDGEPLSPAAPVPLGEAIVGLADLPPRRLGWGQYRTLGALALDLCAVADGRLDAYLDCGVDAHGPWDYLGGVLICREAGAVVEDAQGRDLVVLGHDDRRTPVAASSDPLHAECMQARSTFD